MSTDERARLVVNEVDQLLMQRDYEGSEIVVKRAIRAAQEEEQKRIRLLCAEWRGGYFKTWAELIAAIKAGDLPSAMIEDRARGQGQAEAAE